MNLQDQVIYRCIHAACARPMPRKVNFCPYCGTGQHAGVVNPAHAAHVAPAASSEYRAEPALPAAPAAPEAPVPVLAAAVVAAAVAPPAQAAVPLAPPVAVPVPPPPPPATPVPPTHHKGVAAAPPKREPVRLRYWLIALLSLWLIWLYAKPSSRNVDAKIDSAIAASEECRLNDAQSALIELRMTKASEQQIARVQSAVAAAANTCGKKQARVKAWSDTTTAVDSALLAGDYAKAQARLSQFTRKYNEDGETRKLKERIAKQRAAAAPLEVPVERVERVERVEQVDNSAGQRSQSVRNLINEAERALQTGNYKAASDKLETCMTMVDAGNRECAAFKVHADRLLRDMQACLGRGRDWYEDRCH